MAASLASDLGRKAAEAFVDDTQATSAAPTASLLANRAQAFTKLGDFAAAAKDAADATALDPSMHRAYLRRAQACVKLGQYEPARAAAEAGTALASGDACARFARLTKEIDEKLAPKEICEAAAAVAVGKPKYRHDYYGSATEVVVTVFAKGVAAEHVTVEFGEQTLSLSVEVPGEAPYHLQPRLFGKIVPCKCSFAVLPTKIEVRLAKATPAAPWTSLEYTATKKQPKLVAAAATGARPSYPWSSSKGKKDWDRIEAEVKKEEKEEKLEGDAAANRLFRDIYGNADEDMRRAMMKSFVESNGTVLSTSWEDVGSKKIETSAPQGMELRKWEY